LSGKKEVNNLANDLKLLLKSKKVKKEKVYLKARDNLMNDDNDAKNNLKDKNNQNDESNESKNTNIISDLPTKFKIVTLYSNQSKSKTEKAFENLPPSVRLIIISTNIAETSLTIPGIR